MIITYLHLPINNNYMTKIIEKTKNQDMQLHIKAARNILKEHLPNRYVEKVADKLPDKDNISFGTIRNVKNGLSDRIDVLNALVEVAVENKELNQKFSDIITQNK